MWPGQQPPGGEQNPHEQNPYQQPGYHQPNPYQQPGYQQPNPYQQPPQQQQPQQQPQPGQPAYPGQPQQQPGYAGPHQQPHPQQPPQGWGGPSAPPGAPQPPHKKRTATIAVVTAVAVVAAAAVAAVFVLGKDDGENDESNGKKPSGSSAPASSEAPSGSDRGDDNPRDGEDEEDVKPVIPGWKTVVSAKRHNAFDVPANWGVESSGLSIGFEDDNGKPLVVMSAPGIYKKDYCTVKDEDGYENKSDAAGAGSKGAQGAKSEASAARIEAGNWAFAAFDQDKTGKLKVGQSKKFTSDHGLKGYTASATVTGVKKTDKCTTDGKSVAVSYTDTNGDFATWVLYSEKGTKNEVPDATIKKIMSSLRPLKSETGF
ncbi:hypothetical protein [Streptomyces cucumeris]|uniref:hypothetical protein n=1 Tax=Streptomyces cucumeris TaxID=2962890 RepID=UPI0020C8A450|nr:hypothetical protein [Streptomyces sp. NEAU-Y11]MCP9207827.1 hypothetical protein [Streptomyces sp. NEAU-Y11]